MSADTFCRFLFFYFDDETVSFFDKTNILCHYGVPLNRANCDKQTNNNGHWLLDICKNNNLFIVNGRIGKDTSIGAPTFCDRSTMNYTIVSAECFKILCEFELLELDFLSWSLKRPVNETVFKKSPIQNNPQNNLKWSVNSRESFVDGIDIQKVDCRNQAYRS